MKYLYLIIAASFLSCHPAASQESIIQKMMTTQEAVVEILATNQDFFDTNKTSAAIDAKTGRIILGKKMAHRSYQRSGAGVIVHPAGVIVTNAHTANNADMIRVTLNSGQSFYAEPIQLINALDLLLLKIRTDQSLPFVRMADSDQLSLGQEVITIGNSPLLKKTISGGKIIGLGVNRRLKHTGKHRTDLIQTTVNLYQGDSGGPLFNQQGQLIGLMTADEGSVDHSSFAIPSNKITTYLMKYLNSMP